MVFLTVRFVDITCEPITLKGVTDNSLLTFLYIERADFIQKQIKGEHNDGYRRWKDCFNRILVVP